MGKIFSAVEAEIEKCAHEADWHAEHGPKILEGLTSTDPRVPVGGVKNSGYGRELSHFGAHAFVNAQTVWIEAA